MDMRAELETILPPRRVLTRPIERYAYAHDASPYRLIPQAVVQPASLTEIGALFTFSQSHHIPLVFRAGGTSLSGQAITDGILVDLSKDWMGYAIQDGGRTIELQPGVIGANANLLLKPFNRRIGPDPASIDAAMLGGMLANNASGMCCGIIENAYRTLVSLKVVLPGGLVLNTADPDAAHQLQEGAPQVYAGLRELRQRILVNPLLHEKIDTKYHGKNTTGYSLNGLVDFSEPLDMLSHLLIGSEGTLGFIASAVLRTLPVYPFKYTGLLFFRTVQDACDAILPVRDSGARAIEIMDRSSLRSVEDHPGMPETLKDLPESAAALLVEYQCETAEAFRSIRSLAQAAATTLRLLYPPDFTDDPAQQARLWKIRKGLFPSIGGARPSGTTVIIEDITLPLNRMAAGVTDLRQLFQRSGYSEAIIFGHAKDGNLHFVITPSFNTEASIAQYDTFMRALVDLVVNQYGGALKAEHGTGRNIAPFVEAEWGADAYQIMKDLKALFDPQNLLNPGVIINPDPRGHLANLKPLPTVETEIDRCMECGFCEARCPSRRLTLTPRQRIVLRREMCVLEETGSDPAALSSLQSDYRYAGLDTCAVDGLCGLACPVEINTGDLIKHLRKSAISANGQNQSASLARRFGLLEDGMRLAVAGGHAVQALTGPNFVTGISRLGEKVSGRTLFKWNDNVPRPIAPRRSQTRPVALQAVYFPSCITRVMGSSVEPGGLSLLDTLLEISRRADLSLWIPPDSHGLCCGMPFSSKGYTQGFEESIHATLQKFWDWSDHGRLPVIIDSSSCAYTLKSCQKSLNAEDLKIWSQMDLLDAVEYVYDRLLPHLSVHKLPVSVVLHPNCSTRKQELESKLFHIATACADHVTIPLSLDCCGFAGDRGLLFPELTRSATQLEAQEVLAQPFDGYYSTNLTCEIGMRMATHKPYRSFMYLVEEATR
jgi:D-lactate dehydrogenase